MDFNKKTFNELVRKYLELNSSFFPFTFGFNPNLQARLIECHHANTETFVSISQIFRLKHISDLFLLSRAMFESVINMGVLLSTKVPNGVDRFECFKYVEAYKTMVHLKEVEIIPGFVEKIYKPDDVKKITEGRDAFVSKYGAVSNWSGMNMIQRVNLVDSYFPPTWSNSKFAEYLYCQIYRKGSSAAHKTSISFDRTILIKTSTKGKNKKWTRQPIQKALIFAGFHSIINYLLSLRFFGRIVEGREDEVEAYYQNEINRIIGFDEQE